MRILLVALNARFVHSNLAVRYLRGSLKHADVKAQTEIREFSINDSLENIAAEIYEEKPDVLGFSCYIWNITLILRLLRHLRQVMPQTLFLVGGPEVSFEAEGFLMKHNEIDAVVIGEGEIVLPELIKQFHRGRGLWNSPGVVWRLRRKDLPRNRLLEEVTPEGFLGKIAKGASGPQTLNDYIVTNPLPENMVDLNRLPDPYDEDEDFSGKLVYVETSRGCPYNCRFCISSTFRGVRYLNPEVFRGMLRRLFAAGARTIKFVDRTFNANKQHGFAILQIFRDEALNLMRQEGAAATKDAASLPTNHTNMRIPRAHCEMAGELLDKEWLEFLISYPKDMIQLEIGVQSTHQPTLEAVNRPQNFSKWCQKIEFLRQNSTIPIHLDLIAGLPLEGWAEFKKSFNDVYKVLPDHLQLGSLKILKGSGLWEKKDEYGLVYSPDPPYTIMQTQFLSHDEMLALMRIEEVLEMYVNSGRFVYIWQHLLKNHSSPFDVFNALAEFWHKNRWFRREWNSKALYHNLWQFISDHYLASESRHEDNGRLTDNRQLVSEKEICRNSLKFDYLLARQGEVPDYLKKNTANDNFKVEQSEKSRMREQIRTDPTWQRMIPELTVMDRRQWARASEIEYFDIDIPAGCKDIPTWSKNISTWSKEMSIFAQKSIFPMITKNEINPEGVFYLFFYSDRGTCYYRI